MKARRNLMCLFKKRATKNKKKKEKQEECWYNNAHEESFSARGKGGVVEYGPLDAAVIDLTVVQQNTANSR